MKDKEYYMHKSTQSIILLLKVDGTRKLYKAKRTNGTSNIPEFTVDENLEDIFNMCWRRISKLEMALRGIKV